jgi:branched-chain amino acid transport system substrate-binding protein
MLKTIGGLALAAGIMNSAIAADPIKVGSVLSVTGPAAFLGDPELKSLQMYVDELNKKGGLLGRPLQLVHYDDGSDANKANAFAKRLIEDDKVDFIVGGTTTGSTMSMVPLIEKAGLPFMSLAGAVVVVEPVKKWVFKASTTDRIAAERVLTDMKKRGMTKIALLSDTAGFGQSGKAQTESVVAKYGITLVANETYGPKDTDASPQLTKIRNTPGVEAIFVFGFGQGPAIVTKNIKQLGIELPVYHAHGVGSDEFIKLAGPAAEGVRALAPALMIADKLPASDPQKPVVSDSSGPMRGAGRNASRCSAAGPRQLLHRRRSHQARRLARQGQDPGRNRGDQEVYRHRRRGEHDARGPHGTGYVVAAHARSEEWKLGRSQIASYNPPTDRRRAGDPAAPLDRIGSGPAKRPIDVRPVPAVSVFRPHHRRHLCAGGARFLHHLQRQ